MISIQTSLNLPYLVSNYPEQSLHLLYLLSQEDLTSLSLTCKAVFSALDSNIRSHINEFKAIWDHDNGSGSSDEEETKSHEDITERIKQKKDKK